VRVNLIHSKLVFFFLNSVHVNSVSELFTTLVFQKECTVHCNERCRVEKHGYTVQGAVFSPLRFKRFKRYNQWDL
jgi:hypothetical protein